MVQIWEEREKQKHKNKKIECSVFSLLLDLIGTQFAELF